MIEETDAGGELVRRPDKSVSVMAAFRVKDSEEGHWYFYIASDQINDNNLGVAYAEVLPLADQIASPYLDPFQVKLISTSDPHAKAALEIHTRFPRKMPIRLGGMNFGGLGVDSVYIYPASVAILTP